MICGILGWCLEIIFTAFQAWRKRKMKLIGQTSVWMFPIYGMASLIFPCFQWLRKYSIWIRGTVYMGLIFTLEYCSGRVLKKKEICPWDYSHARHQKDGIIRYDYAPAWFITGLLFERLLTPQKSSGKSFV